VGIAEFAGSAWIRALSPVLVLVLFELLTRYLAKNDNQRLRAGDYFFALPLLGAAIAALPGLIALRAENHPSEGEIAAGGFVLVVLVISACWLVVFDKRTLRKHRADGGRWRRIFWATVLPDLLAAICLGLVFAYAPS
jgi:uncharacterized membrane protein